MVGPGSRLSALGASLADPHVTVIGRVNEAFGHVYGGQPHLGLAAIDGLVASLGEVAPSDRAWLAYVAGEAHGDDDAVRAAMDLDRADVLATRSATACVSGVARTSQASLLARPSDLRAALPVFSAVIAEFRRQGDVTHLVTVLRNLVVLLVDAGELAAGVRLHAALSADGGEGLPRPRAGTARRRDGQGGCRPRSGRGGATGRGGTRRVPRRRYRRGARRADPPRRLILSRSSAGLRPRRASPDAVLGCMTTTPRGRLRAGDADLAGQRRLGPDARRGADDLP